MPNKLQREHLAKLSAYMRSLPKNYAHFDMYNYMGGNKKIQANYALHNGGVDACGTVACGIGHGPAAGILANEDEIRRYADGTVLVSWYDYARRAFGLDAFRSAGAFLFNSSWKYYDNTPTGLADRIDYYLATGRYLEVGDTSYKGD